MPLKIVLSFVFFISGASALIFEVIWFRLAGLFLGNSIWASSLVLATFMAGLAIGNVLAGRYSMKIKRPLRLYAYVEMFIGCTGLIVIALFPYLISIFFPLFSVLLGNPVVLNISRAIVAFCVILVPTVAMGATLPLLVRSLYPAVPRFGQVLGILYGWNTLGAVAGVILTESVLVKAFGIHGTGIFAACLNALAAFIIFGTFAKGEKTKSVHEMYSPGEVDILRAFLHRPVLAAFCSGFILLSLEVVWFRFLLLYYNGHSWNFAVMLAVVLAGIGLGGLFSSWWYSRDPDAHRFLFPLFLCNGLLVILLYGNYAAVITRPAGPDPVRSLEVAALYLMFPVSFISGIVFVMLGKKLHLADIPEGLAAGVLTMANTTGAMLGALVAGFMGIPFLGVERTFLFLAAGYGVIAIVAGPVKSGLRPGRETLYKGALFGVFVVAVMAFPRDHMYLFHIEAAAGHYIEKYGEERVAFREGTSETIQYLRKTILDEDYYYRLITNNYSMSGTGLSAKRYMKLFAYLPQALLSNPEKALLICFGTGSTAKALTENKQLKHIDIVDTSKDVLELSSIIYHSPGENPLHDQRVRAHVDDGRFFLQTAPERYDIITAEPPPPKFNGVVNLYSQEYFQLIYDRLADGGMATYWLPVYQLESREARAIVKGFCNVFADCSLWTGAGLEWIMAGTRKPVPAVHEDDFAGMWDDPVTGKEMLSLGLAGPEQFGSLFIADGDRLRKWLGDVEPLRDDFPLRLSPKAVRSSRHIHEYADFMDPHKSSVNFLASDTVKRRWPPVYRRKAAGHFAGRSVINGLLDPMVSRYPRVIALDLCINTPGLRSYIPWVFESDEDAREIILSRMNKGDHAAFDGRGINNHLAAMAARQGLYGEAAAHMEAAAAEAGKEAWEQMLVRMYLLVLAGKRPEAEAVSNRYLAANGSGNQDAGRFAKIWQWLDNVAAR